MATVDPKSLPAMLAAVFLSSSFSVSKKLLLSG
jgi:hypothetical protein